MTRTASNPEIRALAGWRKRLPINSFGLRLFSMIMGGTLLGIGGMTFLFAETVKYQAEEQIRNTLDSEVSRVNKVIDRAENMAYSLGVSVSTLHVRGAETPGTYQELTRQLFQGRPIFVSGLGFGQRDYGVISSREWFYPYYTQAPLSELSDDVLVEEQVTLPPGKYQNLAEGKAAYAASETYRQYFLPKQARWTTPYSSDRGLLLTYYAPIFDNQNQWLGTTVVDIDAAYLSTVIDKPLFRGAGDLLLLTEDGRVIANSDSTGNLGNQTFEDIPDLSGIWPNMSANESGFVEADNGYWAYTQIPGQNWRVLAYVPYRAVFGPILLITLSATVLVSLLLTAVVMLAIRYLNQRLRPVIDECTRLSEEDAAFSEKMTGQDELKQLSLSFFNLLDQLKLSQAQVQEESAHAIAAEEQLKFVKAKAIAEQMRQQQATQQLEDETAAQSLSILNHFTHLLDALTQMSDQVRNIEQTMTSAQSQVQQQRGLLTQLQSNTQSATGLAESLLAQADELAAASYVPAADGQDLSVDELTNEISQLQLELARLSRSFRDVFAQSDDIARDTRTQQRVTSAAQVILTNTTTLAMSATQQRSPEAFEMVVAQFKESSEQLNQLAEELNTTGQQQQPRLAQMQAAATTFQAQLTRFGQTLKTSIRTLSSPHPVASAVTSEQPTPAQQQLTQTRHALAQLSESLQQALNELNSAIATAEGNVNAARAHTQQVEQMTEELADTTAGFLQQARSTYSSEIERLSA